MSKLLPDIMRIGTSGIVVPGPKTSFPAEFQDSSRLHYYSSLFNTLEVNSSFYKIPQAKTLEKWAAEVPDDFKFTVKCWKGITHQKHLQFTNEDIDKFMSACEKLGAKAACLLIQFPASIDFNYADKVEAIISRIAHNNKNERWLLATELRHLDWYCEVAYEMFAKYKAAVVFHDMPKSRTPLDVPVSDFMYLRFHGPAGDYKGSYNLEYLKHYAMQIKLWQKQAKNIYIYFNNTLGDAFNNAQTLREFLRHV